MFAHATGFAWDEALLVMAPIAVVAGLLFLANSRAKKLQADQAEQLEPGGEPENEPDEPDRR